MRLRDLGVLALLLSSSTGCAAVFRPQRQDVAFTSLPPGAQVELDEDRGTRSVTTPGAAQVARNKTTYVTMRSPGYKTHRGIVPKSTSVGWAIADTLTCVVPVALCIPLIVDAFTGAWVDVDETYEGRLEPGQDPVPGPPSVPPGAPPAAAPGAPGSVPQPSPVPGTGPDIRI